MSGSRRTGAAHDSAARVVLFQLLRDSSAVPSKWAHIDPVVGAQTNKAVPGNQAYLERRLGIGALGEGKIQITGDHYRIGQK